VLRLSELLAEKKPLAKLIVLSACETGTGQLYKGEGVFSFNRGFAALGIPSSVSNLWSVDNVSTYHLTELFYKYLARGLPMDEALQKAKLEFMRESSKEKALPFYWAGAILAGKTDAIQLKKSPSSTFIVLLITLSCVLVFAYALWSRRRTY
jgi:CHAT domain-containing protein